MKRAVMGSVLAFALIAAIAASRAGEAGSAGELLAAGNAAYEAGVRRRWNAEDVVRGAVNADLFYNLAMRTSSRAARRRCCGTSARCA
jgi:hypothetical protein